MCSFLEIPKLGVTLNEMFKGSSKDRMRKLVEWEGSGRGPICYRKATYIAGDSWEAVGAAAKRTILL